jgi:hypothetical protein
MRKCGCSIFAGCVHMWYVVDVSCLCLAYGCLFVYFRLFMGAPPIEQVFLSKMNAS